MRSSSDSIAQLASALAKAQVELVNPAKTLTGVIPGSGAGREGRSYRYAPLSAGLEIVRKTLGRHELAVIQTTHVERETAVVVLTTTLAHGSGEWIAASWPVCRAADMAHPKLMGAALTYARRYGLFTLVGLAGEDDLDSPEMTVGEGPSIGSCQTEASTGAGNYRSAAPDDHADRPEDRRTPNRHRAGIPEASEASAAEPQAFVHELALIDNPDALFRWALASLPGRNRLSPEARVRVDAAFVQRVQELGADPELLVAFAPSPEADPEVATLPS